MHRKHGTKFESVSYLYLVPAELYGIKIINPGKEYGSNVFDYGVYLTYNYGSRPVSPQYIHVPLHCFITGKGSMS